MASTSSVFAARLALACMISPMLAGPVGVFVHGLIVEPRETLETLALVPFILLVTPLGFYGYFFALLGALLVGLPLAIAARSVPSLRRKRIWLAAGSVVGAALGLLLGKFTALGALVGASAGAATALAFRLLVGSSLKPRRSAD